MIVYLVGKGSVEIPIAALSKLDKLAVPADSS